MEFISTRDPLKNAVSAAYAIKEGLAPDGGLYVPTELPTLTQEDICFLAEMNYPERAAEILGRFLTDYTKEELLADCRAAYAESAFPGGAAPLADIGNGLFALELWHGPTAAFKDMALQIMPRLLSRALAKTGEIRDAVILVATSGDTGKAALEGYRDIDRIRIAVFYPENGVSPVQKLQMQTQAGKNVNVTAIRGNFDDAQTGVKEIFSDRKFAEELNECGLFLSSANSINWGRLAPQIVYYVSAYCDLLNAGKLKFGEPVNICVPTGNFGNILAAYLAKKMGVPLGKLICASNRNNVLTDFLTTGTYDRNRAFYLTMSPSMDILISSNLERLLYFVAGEKRTAEYMRALRETGKYTVEPDILATIRQDFAGYFTDEAETSQTIRAFFESGYLADTHTAVALHAATEYRTQTDDRTPIVIASTASPFKFATDVYRSVTGNTPAEPLTAPERLSELSGWDIPYPLKGLRERKIRFTKTVEKNEMRDAIRLFLSGTEQ